MGDASGPALVTCSEAAAEEDHQNGGEGVPSSELENGKSGNGIVAGNRWPRPETLSLLQIRSNMDPAFKDSTLKGPLWEQISRKMAELGYKRSAKKCKEKFENVYKYHKRTKEGRLSGAKPDGKSYRFFQELEAFDQKNQQISPPPPAKPKATPSSSSSSTASDEEFQAPQQPAQRKRKLKEYFRQLTEQVVEKQEEMHRRFTETVARSEAARAAREQAWRAGEASRLDQLARDSAAAAAKDSAVLSLLRALAPRPADQRPINADPISSSLPPPDPLLVGSTSSRWPKAEVETLIRVRTTLESKYGESGPKGPLWEEISAAMRRAGFHRSAKRCKEKWENINKYFKKVKDNNKMRSQDSKTCPYFHTLDALYRDKTSTTNNGGSSLLGSEPLLVQPESQWPTAVTTAHDPRGFNLLDHDHEDSSGTEVDDHHHSNDDRDHQEVTVTGRGEELYGVVSKKVDMVG